MIVIHIEGPGYDAVNGRLYRFTSIGYKVLTTVYSSTPIARR